MQTIYHIDYKRASNQVLLDTLDYYIQVMAKQTDNHWNRIDTPLKREYKEAFQELRHRLCK